MISSSPGVIGLYWYSGCFISWVSPLREDGASTCVLDILELLAALYLECPYYMHHLENLELHVPAPDLWCLH